MRKTEAQLKAITARQTSLCVNANAGTGKTLVLVERIVDLIRTKAADTRSILAVTFTDKAAEEIKERLAQEMKKQSLPYWEVENAYISTIHAFCARLLRENCFTAGINPGFAVSTETEADILLENAVAQTIASRLQQDDTAVLEILDIFPTAKLIEAVPVFIKKLRAAGLLDKDLAVIASQTVQDIARQNEEFYQALMAEIQQKLLAKLIQLQKFELGEKLDQVCAKLHQLLSTPPKSSSWAAIAEAVGELDLRKRRAKTDKEIVAALCKRLKYLVKHFPALSISPEAETDYQKSTGLLVAFTQEVLEKYAAEKDSRKILDFEDLQLKALELLRASTAVRDFYKKHFRFILLDEFQDTNHLQKEIIELIVSDNNLFIVGDWKQSIYLFRNADVEIFRGYMEKYASGQTGQNISLQENFRSNKQILNFVNFICRQTFQGFPAYEDLLPYSQTVPGENSVHLDFIEQAEAEDAAAGRVKEAVQLAARIKQARQDGFTYKDMAVLLRKITNLEIYERILRQAGIPYFIVAGKGYYNKQEIADILNLLTILADPHNDIALAGVLRSELVNLSDEALFLLSKLRSTDNLWSSLDAGRIKSSSILPEEQQKLLTFINLYAELASYSKKLSVPEFLHYLLQKTQLLSLALTGADGLRAAANLNKLLDVAESFSAGTEGDIKLFRSYLQSMQEREAREEEAAVLDEKADVVKIMTIHKAKGLEFPVVFLAELTQELKNSSVAINFDQHLYKKYGISAGLYYQEETGEKQESPSHALIAYYRRQAEQEEAKRLFYVALTRAKTRLYLLARCPAKESTETSADSSVLQDSPNWSTWLKYLYSQDQKNFQELAEINMVDRVTLEAATQEKTKPLILPDKIDISRFTRSSTAELKFSKISATQIGELLTDKETFLKKYYLGLQDIEVVRQERGVFNKADSEAVGNAVHSCIPQNKDKISARLGPEQQKYAETCLQNYYGSELFKKLQNASQKYFELPFEYQENDLRFEGRMDLVYQDQEGWTILDFKTNRQNQGTLQEYTYQLSVYGYALAKALALPLKNIRLKLFYLYDNELVDISPVENVLQKSTTELLA